MTMQLNRSPLTHTSADEYRRAVGDAIDAARDARRKAERDVRKSEVARAHAALALEANLRPMTLDEAARTRLRAAYAEADAAVAAQRRSLEQASALETAAEVIADALDASAHERQPNVDLADGLLQLLGTRQRSRMRDAAPRARGPRGSAPVAARSTRRQGSQPQ